MKKQKQLNSSEVLNLQDFMDALELSSIKFNKDGLVSACLIQVLLLFLTFGKKILLY